MKKMMLLVAIAISLSGCKDTGTGEKIGVLTKVAQQGVFCKTYEAEMIRGGFNGGTGANGSAFHFTIENEETAKKLEEAMVAQKEIHIHYRSEFATFCRSDSDGNHFLTSFEVIEPTTKNMNGTVEVASSTNEDDVKQLLKVQAQLINKLFNKQ